MRLFTNSSKSTSVYTIVKQLLERMPTRSPDAVPSPTICVDMLWYERKEQVGAPFEVKWWDPEDEKGSSSKEIVCYVVLVGPVKSRDGGQKLST